MPGGFGGGGGTVPTYQTSTTNQGPWNQQGPYLQQGFAQAGNLAFNTPLQPWQGTTVSPWNPQQSAGFGGLVNTALGNPITPGASNLWNNTVSGNYLDPSTNPWLASTFSAAAQPLARTFQNITAPSTDAMFGAAGPLSGGAWPNAQSMNQQNLAQALTNLATGIYGGNYQFERGNQMGALGMTPQMQQAQYFNPAMLMEAGGMQQGQAQKELSGQIGQFYTGQQLPWQTLQNYMGIVGSNNWGQQGTTQTMGQQPYYTNPLATGLGGILGLGSLAGQLGWSPFSAATLPGSGMVF